MTHGLAFYAVFGIVVGAVVGFFMGAVDRWFCERASARRGYPSLPDFSPDSQDAAAKHLIESRSAIETAKEAARRIREIGLKYKPSKKHGATKALRELRDLDRPKR
jgi:hypothetical protein